MEGGREVGREWERERERERERRELVARTAVWVEGEVEERDRAVFGSCYRNSDANDGREIKITDIHLERAKTPVNICVCVCVCVMAAGVCTRGSSQRWLVCICVAECVESVFAAWLCVWNMLSADLQSSSAACARGRTWDVRRVCHRGTRQRGRQRFGEETDPRLLICKQLGESLFSCCVEHCRGFIFKLSVSALEDEPSCVCCADIWKSDRFPCRYDFDHCKDLNVWSEKILRLIIS